MCGINGIIRFDGQTVEEELIDVMNKKIVHRGPDDQGVFVENGIGLGHVRLSIIDLSEKGHQPMAYEHKGRWAVITYNGEVYNFKDLRQELESKGYNFNSGTDTEVLLASYMEDGVDCIKKWNGMFAFVIYDPKKQILFGARDRFGQKPFKYYIDDKQFIFSSELKAILENDVKRELDIDAIDEFLTLQYVPAPKTGFKNIFKLPHAHYFRLDLKSKTLEINRYFDMDYSGKLSLSKKAWMNKIEDRLGEALRKRLIADVPLGAFLSGGVDSSAIVAFMSKYTDKIKTFSVSFDEKDFDESQYARIVAEKYKTGHTEFKVDSKDMLRHIEELVVHYEEPYADSSQLPTFILSKLTKQHVTVALSGDAGDENFGGYAKYVIHRWVLLAKWLLWLLKPFQFIIPGKKAKVLLRTLSMSIARRHYNFTNYFDEFSKAELYRDDFKDRLTKRPNTFEDICYGKNLKKLDTVYYTDFNSYIPDDINVKVDMASMFSALEVRSPFLDYELVSLTAKMPYKFKTGFFQGKKIFRKMLRKYLPKNVLYRKKHGFSVPIKHWFRNELKDYIKKTVLDKNGIVLQVMKKEKVEELVKDHSKGHDNAKKLWTLMVLNLWHEKYF